MFDKLFDSIPVSGCSVSTDHVKVSIFPDFVDNIFLILLRFATIFFNFYEN